MVKRLLGMGVIGLLAFSAMPALADSLIEIRGGVGLVGSDPKDFNDAVDSSLGSGLKASSFDNYNVDVYVDIPVLPIGVGLRYEELSDKMSSGGASWDMNVNNLSVIADWRILNNVVYVGPIVGVGYPWGDLSYTGGSENLDKSQLTYTVGGEAGLKLGRFIVGAELGYSSLALKTDDGTTKVDLSGVYGKAMVGIGLF